MKNQYGVQVDGHILTEDQFGTALTKQTANELAKINRGISVVRRISVWTEVEDYRLQVEQGVRDGGYDDAA